MRLEGYDLRYEEEAMGYFCPERRTLSVQGVVLPVEVSDLEVALGLLYPFWSLANQPEAIWLDSVTIKPVFSEIPF